LAHSLGVAHIARKLLETLQRNDSTLHVSEERAQDIFLAALCHDVGHGPYSHLWDELFAQQLTHEARSALIFAKIAQQHLPHFSAARVAVIQSFINPDANINSADRWQYEVVCNMRTGVDVDKFDYIVRDSHLSRTHSNFDLNAMLNSARVINNQLEYAAEFVNELFGVRAALHARVYNNPIVTSLELALAELLRENAARYYYCTNDAAAACSDAFLHLDDASVIHSAQQSALKDDVRSRRGFFFWGSVLLSDIRNSLHLPEDEGNDVRLVERSPRVEYYSRFAPSPRQMALFANLNPRIL
jgi:HD superfamily phosphohydrolase